MYTIVLPKNLNKLTIRQVVIKFRQYVDDFSNGSELLIDMTKVEFIDPAGMVSLSNIIQWSKKNKSVEITFLVDDRTQNDKNRSAMEYLSDCGFFANFGEPDIFKQPKLRSTTLSLKGVEAKQAYQWKQRELLFWLRRQTNRKNEFSSIGVAIDEIFNNISDHSMENIGCIFGQFYPKINQIVISISDFGVGIPQTIRETFNLTLSDDELIEYALTEGVSSQSVPQNRGAGLSNIMKTLTRDSIARVTIISNCGMIELSDNQVVAKKLFKESYPGTFFELIIDVANEKLYDSEEEEEFEW